MADTPEAVASRLDQYVGDAVNKTPGAQFQHQVGASPKVPTVRDVYARCLSTLSDAELAAFASALDRMRAALGR